MIKEESLIFDPRQHPKISVVMTVYNGEPFLREAVDSILNQTFKDFEFIIVDDGSTDNTAQILDSYDDARIVRVHNLANLGLTRSLNRGLAACRGEFIARQDADDISLPSRFSEQVDFLERHPDIGVLGTQMDFIDENGNFLFKYEVPISHSMIVWRLFFGPTLAHATVMIRRSLIEKIGGYDPTFPYVEDLELWTRLVEITHCRNLSNSLYRSQLRYNSVCQTKGSEQLFNINMVRRRFANRVLGRQGPFDEINWLTQSRFPQNRLTEEQRNTAISLIRELYNALLVKGLILNDECQEVAADMEARIARASGHVSNDITNDTFAQSPTKSLPRPIHLLAKAAKNPQKAIYFLRQQTKTLRSRFVPVYKPRRRSLALASEMEQAGITVIVLSDGQPSHLTPLLRSLLEQTLFGIQLELIICINSPKVLPKQSRFSLMGRLLSQFPDIKIINSSYDWRWRIRYAIATLASYPTVMFIDEDMNLLNRSFINYMYENFRTLRPIDILSCRNILWVDWNEDFITCASLTFETSAITELTQTDTISPGICMFNKQLLWNFRLFDLSKRYPKADDLAFPLIAAAELGSRCYFLPSYNMVKVKKYKHTSLISEWNDDLYSQLKALLKNGYKPVLSRNANNSYEQETKERYAVRVLPAVKHYWK